MLEIKQVYEHFAGARSSDWSLKASSKPTAAWGSLALDVNQWNKDKQPHKYNCGQCSVVSSVVRKSCAFVSCSLWAHCQNFPFQNNSEGGGWEVRQERRREAAPVLPRAKPWPGRVAVSQGQEWGIWVRLLTEMESWKPELSIRPSEVLKYLFPSTTLSPCLFSSKEGHETLRPRIPLGERWERAY